MHKKPATGTRHQGVRDGAHEQVHAVQRDRRGGKVVFSHPAAGKGNQRKPEQQMQVGPQDRSADFVDGVEQVVVVPPIWLIPIMQNTYPYIRFSHEKQAEGSSYDRQLGEARKFCPSLIEDKEHIYFDSGKSAFHGKQMESGGELRRFYDNVKSGKVSKGSVLLVEDLDRLSRAGMWKASDKLRELTENGVSVRTLRDGKLYEGTLKFSDAITSLIKQEVANEESEKKSVRVAASYRNRYARAKAGKKVKVLLPSWLEWVSDDKPYRVKEAEAKVVRDIFTQAAAGHS